LLPANDNSSRGVAAVDVSAFKLSRIFAEGWNAAHKLSGGECDRLSLRAMSALNPYRDEPGRSRWVEGFTEALGN
jgi:hypothetical protein